MHSNDLRTDSTAILSLRSEQARLRAEMDELTRQYALHSETWRQLQIQKVHLLNQRPKREQASELQHLHNQEKYVSHVLKSCVSNRNRLTIKSALSRASAVLQIMGLLWAMKSPQRRLWKQRGTNIRPR